MSKERKSLFAECGKCGERWKIATLPMAIGELCKQSKRLMVCPRCGEKHKTYLCPTVGDLAVTESRNGRAAP